MAKFDLNPQLLAHLVAGSPEGFFKLDELERYSRCRNGSLQALVEQAVDAELVGQVNGSLYDPARLSAEIVRERSQWYRGSLPSLNKNGQLTWPSIISRLTKRQDRLAKLDNPT